MANKKKDFYGIQIIGDSDTVTGLVYELCGENCVYLRYYFVNDFGTYVSVEMNYWESVKELLNEISISKGKCVPKRGIKVYMHENLYNKLDSIL